MSKNDECSHLLVWIVSHTALLSIVALAAWAARRAPTPILWLLGAVLVIAHEISELLVAPDRPLNDEDAPVDAPRPAEDVEGEELEDAHRQLSLVCKLALRHARRQDSPAARQHHVQGEGYVGDNVVDRRYVRQKLEESHIVCVDGHCGVLDIVEAVRDIVPGQLVGGLVGILLG